MAATEVVIVPVEKTPKKGTSKRAKSAAPRKPRAEPLHPSYFQMIAEAIIALKERSGSSQFAIAKYIEAKYKNVLPSNFRTILSVQLRNLVKQHKLVKVKASYKLTEEGKRQAAPKRTKKVGGAAGIKKAVKKTVAKEKATHRKKATPRKTKSPRKAKPAKKVVKVAKPVSSVPAKKTVGTKRTTPAKKRGPKKTVARKPAAKRTPKLTTTAKREAKKVVKSIKMKIPPKSPRGRKPAAKRVKRV